MAGNKPEEVEDESSYLEHQEGFKSKFKILLPIAASYEKYGIKQSVKVAIGHRL